MGGSFPGINFPGGQSFGNNFPGGNFLGGRGNFPRTMYISYLIFMDLQLL